MYVTYTCINLHVFGLDRFADALGLWHVHQEPRGHLSHCGSLVNYVQTAVRFCRIHDVHVLHWEQIPSLPTSRKYSWQYSMLFTFTTPTTRHNISWLLILLWMYGKEERGRVSFCIAVIMLYWYLVQPCNKVCARTIFFDILMKHTCTLCILT